jgi:hypothetical protein
MIAGMLIWTIPYTIACLITLALTAEFPTSVTTYIIFAITVAITGIYGIFIREVTRFVVRVHPIQTTIYVTIVSSLILTVSFLFVFVLAAIPGLKSVGSQGLRWAFISLYASAIFLFKLTAATSFVSILISQALPPTETEQIMDVNRP